MRLHRFFVNEPVGERRQLTLNSVELVHQVSRVFRLGVGDSIIIFDGSGYDFECSIDSFGEKTIISAGKNQSIVLSVATKRRSAFSPGRIDLNLYMALVKKDIFEWIVQKAAELGVSRIIPVMAERSEKKSLNEERLLKISIEASEQSGRGNVPTIEKIVTLEQAVKMVSGGLASGGATSVVFHTEGEHFTPAQISKSAPLNVFIGPEGGWSPAEIEMFHANSIPLYCLGPQVLRAETAAVAALSVMVFGK